MASLQDNFPGYFKPSEDAFTNLWENCLFVLDANILLNFYRYSEETRSEFFKLLNKIKHRIWIPHQSAFEFLENRLGVIAQQEKAYDDMIASLSSIESNFKNSRHHPFISDPLLEKLCSLFNQVNKELEKNKYTHTGRINKDEILVNINQLLSDNVGDEYKEPKLQQLFKEGEERFVKKRPPGFKDKGKDSKGDSESPKKYGDWIMWKQIIDKAQSAKKDIILITDDVKEDWWLIFKGKTIGPRPELTKEFKSETGQEFYMYQADQFAEYARINLKQEIKQEIIKELTEVREINESDKEAFLKLKNQYYVELASIEIEMESLRKQKLFYSNELNKLQVIQEEHPERVDLRVMMRYAQEVAMIDQQLKEWAAKANMLKVGSLSNTINFLKNKG